jgi:hypothetical protein
VLNSKKLFKEHTKPLVEFGVFFQRKHAYLVTSGGAI